MLLRDAGIGHRGGIWVREEDSYGSQTGDVDVHRVWVLNLIRGHAIYPEERCLRSTLAILHIGEYGSEITYTPWRNLQWHLDRGGIRLAMAHFRRSEDNMQQST